MGAPVKPLAFIIMPFDESFESIYTDLIKPPLEDVGFEVRRGDSFISQRNILQDIVSDISTATLVVADLTGLNPNVMYELGLAHGLGRKTIVLIKDSLDHLPFDLRTYRANMYSTHYREARELATLLRAAGTAAIDGSEQFSNPVLDFSPGALRNSVTPNVAADNESADQRHEGYLEAVVRLNDLNVSMETTANDIAGLLENVGEKATEKSARIERAISNLGDRAASAVLALLNDMARDLDTYSTSLEPLAELIESMLSEFGQHADSIATQMNVSSTEDVAAAHAVILTFGNLEETFVTTASQVDEFVVSLADVPNASELLTRSTRRAAAVTKRLVDAMQSAEAEAARVRGILKSRLPAEGKL